MDVDTGTDDALAILYALGHPDLEVLGISCVAGNVAVDQVVTNTCKVLDAAGAGDIPVAAGAVQPLIERARRRKGPHGPDGLAGILLPPLAASIALACHRTDASADQRLAGAGEPGDTGPQDERGDAAHHVSRRARLEQIIFVGGSVSGGSVTAVAEFNVWQDPEAASCVIEASISTTMYGFDLFGRLAVSKADADRFRAHDHPATRLAGELLNRRRVDSNNSTHDYVGSLGDAGAMVLLTNPELFVTRELPVRVNLYGIGRGQTIVDQRAALGHGPDPDTWPKVGVGVDLDATQAPSKFVKRRSMASRPGQTTGPAMREQLEKGCARLSRETAVNRARC